MDSLKNVLMTRDDLTSVEVDELIEAARERVLSGDDPEEVLFYEFGLEPDYIMDLLQ